MSYPGLIGYTDHAQAGGEEFFDEIIFFVIERGAAEMADRSRMINCCAILLADEGALTRFPDAVRHHVHRTIHRNFCPLFRARCAIFYFRFTLRMCEQLIRRCTLWTKIPLADRTFRIAFDRNQFAVFVINELAATDTEYGQIERATFAPSILARIARVLSDIDSRPVPSLRSRICLTSGHFESSANIVSIHFFAAGANFSCLKMS